MPFEKGHPYHPPVEGRAGGPTRTTRRYQRSLAITIREEFPPDEMFRWLRCVAAGIDPDARPAEGDPNGSVSQTPIDMAHRLRAMKMLLERGLGKAAQLIVTEAAVTSQA